MVSRSFRLSFTLSNTISVASSPIFETLAVSLLGRSIQSGVTVSYCIDGIIVLLKRNVNSDSEVITFIAEFAYMGKIIA